MNPKMTEFLGQDRIAGLRSEAAGHHVLKSAATGESKAHSETRAETATAIALVWRRVRRAVAV